MTSKKGAVTDVKVQVTWHHNTFMHIQNYAVIIIKTMVFMPAIEYFELNSSLFLNTFDEYATEYEY